MWSAAPTLELAPNVFRILKDLISERAGINYDSGERELLAEKLSPVAIEGGFNNFLDFYYLLKYGPNAEEMWPRVIDVLSVQETYFWREIGQIQALVHELLPKCESSMVAKRPVHIWCAACATGEEPLTIAIALTEAGWFERLDIRISASDFSPSAITRARKGIYRERSFRALPVHLREKYFRATADGWQILPEIAARVNWSIANLMDGSQIAWLAQAKFIYCRNVFIYFAEETIARTIRVFARQMERPGYLFVGAAESLLSISDEFELEEVAGAFVYTRR